MKHLLKTLLLYTVCFFLKPVQPWAQQQQRLEFHQVTVLLGTKSGDVEKLVAELLRDRIFEKSQVEIEITQNPENIKGLVILLGRP